MLRAHRLWIVWAVCLAGFGAPAGEASRSPAGNGSGTYAASVPDFKLKDPAGREHTRESLLGKTGMLILLTVPNVAQFDKQVRWDRCINREKWPEQGAPVRVLLEDMSQQTAFKEKARELMREKYKPGGGLIVLLDEDGAVRRQFGVRQNETVVLLAEANGRIVHNEGDDVVPDPESAKRLFQQVRTLASRQAPPVAPPPGNAPGNLTASARRKP